MSSRYPAAARGALRTSAALASCAALAAGCADSARLTAPTTSGPSATRNTEFNSPRHLFHTREYFAREDASNGAARSARPSTGSGISYHNGPVLLTATNVAAIYWGNPGYNNLPVGSGAGSADGSLLGTFLRSLGGTPYYNINSSYTNGAATPTRIANVVNYTQYWNNPGTPSASPTDANMVAMLQAGLDSHAIAYDSNTVYAIFTGSGINLGGGFITQYCAYHTHGTVSVNGVNKTILYAAMPYNAQSTVSCTSGYAAANGTLDPAADAEVNTLAHEIEETTTDMMGNAWYDSRGYENADKCAWTWGTVQTTSTGGKFNVTFGGTNFLIQQNWVNAGTGGCALSY